MSQGIRAPLRTAVVGPPWSGDNQASARPCPFDVSRRLTAPRAVLTLRAALATTLRKAQYRAAPRQVPRAFHCSPQLLKEETPRLESSWISLRGENGCVRRRLCRGHATRTGGADRPGARM